MTYGTGRTVRSQSFQVFPSLSLLFHLTPCYFNATKEICLPQQEKLKSWSTLTLDGDWPVKVHLQARRCNYVWVSSSDTCLLQKTQSHGCAKEPFLFRACLVTSILYSIYFGRLGYRFFLSFFFVFPSFFHPLNFSAHSKLNLRETPAPASLFWTANIARISYKMSRA